MGELRELEGWGKIHRNGVGTGNVMGIGWDGDKLLHCALSLVMQCIVIGPVCGFATGGQAVWKSVTTITRN